MVDTSQETRRALGEPVIDPLPAETLRLRRTLLALSFFSAFYAFGGIEVASFAAMGVGITGLSTRLVSVGLLLVLVYLLIHFIWLIVDYLGVWRLHLTGTRLHHVTVGKFAGEGADYPDDPAQSNLYYWWGEEAQRIGNLRSIVSGISACADALKAAAEQYEPLQGGLDTQFFSRNANQLQEGVVKLNGSLSACKSALDSSRIPISLERFDVWFNLFKRSQVLRLWLADILLPILLTLTALGGLGYRLLSA